MNGIINTANPLSDYDLYLRSLSNQSRHTMSPKEYGMTLQGKKKKKVKR